DPGEYLPAVLALPLRVEGAVRGLHLQSRMPRLEDASSPLAEPRRPGQPEHAPPFGARPIEKRMEPVDGRRAVPPRERNAEQPGDEYERHAVDERGGRARVERPHSPVRLVQTDAVEVVVGD